jgi:hypothetical protein
VFFLLAALGEASESILAAVLFAGAGLLFAPPVWKAAREKTPLTNRAWPIIGLVIGGVAVGTMEHARSPEGIAEAEAREAADRAREKKEAIEEGARAKEAAAAEAKREKEAAAAKAAELATGEHCFSTWDGSLPALKEAVKSALRNPDSFKMASTSYEKRGDKLMVRMIYRAQNGFGGMNIEKVDAKIIPETCEIISISE